MYRFFNCDRCGRFMSKDGDEWDEFPLGPYVNQDWKCVCGNTRITSDDFRLSTSRHGCISTGTPK